MTWEIKTKKTEYKNQLYLVMALNKEFDDIHIRYGND